MIGFVVGGVASGVGKTTVTLGLIGALRQRGLTVQPFKVGPDYIDPSQHTQVAGRVSRNLDSWMLPESVLRELFGRAASGADAVVVEGVMGLFDGRSGAGEVGSTAQVAKLLGLPVLLVVDAAKAARSVAAVVLGCRMLDPGLRICGVVMNNVASEAHARIVREPIEQEAGVPVLGWLPRDPKLRQEERYLGLVPAAEQQVAPGLLERAMDRVAENVDVERLLSLATCEAPKASGSGLFPAEPAPVRARIAVARDEAFCFYYQDNLDLLEARGAQFVPFSPLDDAELPPNFDGLYLGGGFPELFAERLAGNGSMLASVRAEAARGLPIYGECGGLMYLREGLVDREGQRHAMVGVIPGWSRMDRSRLTLGYREIRARRASLLHEAGDVVRGHEFHWSVGDAPEPDRAAYEVAGGGVLEGYAAENVLASYVHLHFGADARLAPRLVDACAAYRRARMVGAALMPQPRMGTLALAPTVSLSQRETVGACRTHTPPGQNGQIDKIRPGRGEALASQPGSLLRRFGLPPSEIESLSLQRIEGQLDGDLPLEKPARGLVARLVYAAGDPGLAGLVEWSAGAIGAAVEALRDGMPVVVDVQMVAAGVSKTSLEALGSELLVALDAADRESRSPTQGMTRSAAGILALGSRLDGAVVAIGNAPTALLALLDIVEAGIARPAAVIGVPVGFVAAAESKEALRASGLPCIIVRGTRGGSALAAAAVNHLLRLAAR